MRDRMLVASTELTHDQASRNLGGGGGGEARKDSLIADWSWRLGPDDRLWPSAKAYLSSLVGAIYLSKELKYMHVR